MRPKMWSLTLVLFVTSLAPATVAGRPFAFADMVKIQTPSGLALSPDGRELAFTLAGRDLESNSGWAKVMVLTIQSGALTAVSAGGTGESSPAWSPDGKSLAFVSDKSGRGQIWVVPRDNPQAAVQVTHLSTGASSPRFSGDGQSLYFTSRVFASCSDDACNQAELTRREENPVKAQLFTALMYRHWDSWDDGRVTHIHRVQLDGKGVLDLMAHEEWGVAGSWDVSGDDGWVYYTTKNPRNQTLSTNNDLYRFLLADALAGKWAGQKVTENPAYDTTPLFSADGKAVAYLSHQRPGFESDLLTLTLMAVGKQLQAPVRLAEELDRPVNEFGWFPGGKTLWVTVADRGSISLFKVARKGGKTTPILERTFMTDVVLSPDGKTFYAIKHSLTAAPEIYRFAASDGEAAKLTGFNDTVFDGVELAEVEDYWWDGADGDKVHGYLLYPPGTKARKGNKFLLLIHGGPQGAWGDMLHPRWNAQLFAAPGYVTLLANPRGSTGYGQTFTDQISRDWGGRPFVDLMNAVDALGEEGIIDTHKMCAAGGSYGGYMVNWILGHTDRFQCLISHAGVYDLKSKYGSTDELWFPEWEFGGPPWTSDDYDKWSPSNAVEKFATPTLVIHGEHDYRVAVNQAMQLFTALQRREVPSAYLYFPDETHFVVKPKNSLLWYTTIHEWMARWIDGESQGGR